MTIKDIARISGCSVSTISRVINDRPDVRPETKEHVLEIMRQVGFVPNSNARQLKIQQSRSVVFVVKGTQNLFFADFLVQLQQVVGLYGYSGIVSYLDEDANEMEAAGRILREIKPKGMIFLGGSVENFRRSFDQITVPAVLATVVTDELDFPNLSMVGVDDRAAAFFLIPPENLDSQDFSWMPEKRSYTLEFYGVGDLPAIAAHISSFGEDKTIWPKVSLAKKEHILTVQLPKVPAKARVEIRFADGQKPASNDWKSRCFDFLYGAEISFDQKERIWAVLGSQKTRTAMLGELGAMGLKETVTGPLYEFLLAEEG